jgi:predicted dehydrogenase
MQVTSLGRRELLRGAALLPAASYSRIAGANDRLHLGVIGCGSRGRYVMHEFQTHPEVAVASVCDIYGARMEAARGQAPGAQGYADYRRLLESKPLDVVLIATPDHWHARIAIETLNAGFDLYVEKPLTFTIEEGPLIVKAARVNNRICQVGMQQRSGKHYIRAKREYFDTGRLGKISHCRTWWHGNNYFLGRAPDSMRTKPTDLDWAQFLGQVRWRDWDPQQYFSWRAYLDFGGGQITDLFTHWVDVVHMMMGHDVPVSTVAMGGVYVFKDGRTAPDTINALLQYPEEFTVTFEGVLGTGATRGAVEFFGTQGTLSINRERFEFRPAEKNAPPEVVEAGGYDITSDHVANFLEALRSRKPPNGDVLLGHHSVQAAHLANLSYLQKRCVHFDAAREQILPL